jgi:pyruvate-ferredoxin/flavodoxin oxidoreductase
LDSPAPKTGLADYVLNETRYRIIERQNPEHFKNLMALAQSDVNSRFAVYKLLSEMAMPGSGAK